MKTHREWINERLDKHNVPQEIRQHPNFRGSTTEMRIAQYDTKIGLINYLNHRLVEYARLPDITKDEKKLRDLLKEWRYQL